MFLKCCYVSVYLSGKKVAGVEQIRVALTYDITQEIEELANRGYKWIRPLTEKIPIYSGYILKVTLQKRLAKIGHLNEEKNVNKILKMLKKEKHLKERRIEILDQSKPQPLSAETVNQSSDLVNLISAMLRGRNMYLSEITKGLKEMGYLNFSDVQIKKELVRLLVADKVEMLPANLAEQSICLRCGHDQLAHASCGICGQKVWHCPECAIMGESLSCRPIFRRLDKIRILTKRYQGLKLHYSFPLSPYQKRISQILCQSLENQLQKKWLVWAVCGAGKTETTFAVIAEILRRGGRVLFTSPRREVIRQLSERLGKAFPNVSQIAIFGGSQGKLAQAQLTIATIHQLVRYYQAFDLVIFDEVDAFPYSSDQRLHKLLARSLKIDGRLVYLSATPGEDLINEVKSGKLEMVTLPARYHRKGVPVPSIVGVKLSAKPDFFQLPGSLKKWINESIFRDLAQLYIFLPTRKMVVQFGESLKKYFEMRNLHNWVEYTHSKDEERHRKVERFLTGEFPILVTTTILERGVTVPKSNVLVLYADNEQIFNHQSLIQMAGRAGRSLTAPDGLVKFVGKRVSKEMAEAKKWIKKMNQLAKERGLLDDSDS